MERASVASGAVRQRPTRCRRHSSFRRRRRAMTPISFAGALLFCRRVVGVVDGSLVPFSPPCVLLPRSPPPSRRRSSPRSSRVAVPADVASSSTFDGQRGRRKGRRNNASHLAASPSSTSDAVRAAATLIGASSIGMIFDRFVGVPGTIVALVVASFSSNVGWAPSTSAWYDVCWTTFLPASLALVLLPPPPPPPASPPVRSSSVSTGDGGGGEPSVRRTTTTTSSTKETIGAVSIPFLLSSMGSILGCAASFLLLSRRPPPFVPSSIRLVPPHAAAVAAGCLCASYVGGSVNFFATAKILTNDDVVLRAAAGGGGGTTTTSTTTMESLFGSMAAADLLIMALYFALLAGSMKSDVLWRAFPGRHGRSGGAPTKGAVQASSDDDDDVDSFDPPPKRRKRRKLVAGGTAAFLAYLIVEASSRCEAASVPGVACAFIAAFGTSASRLLTQLLPETNQRKPSRQSGGNDGDAVPSSWRRWLPGEIRAVSPMLSDACFYLLFAAIGTSANLGEVLRHGPSAFFFALTALAVHVLVALLGSLGVMRVFPNFRWFPLGLDEVAVASNAAIGGPATAAAFAANACGGRTGGRHRRDLVVAATVWGVVGYSVGTGIGVALTKALLR